MDPRSPFVAMVVAFTGCAGESDDTDDPVITQRKTQPPAATKIPTATPAATAS